MGYATPTLGGLSKLQQFLEDVGHPLPVFETDICTNGVPHVSDLQKMIHRHGAHHQVTDVRLRSDKEDDFVKFVDPVHIGFGHSIWGRVHVTDCVTTCGNGFLDVRDKYDLKIVKMARYGKLEPSLLDQIRFRLSPRRYFASLS